MKKIIAAFLALSLLICVCATASAEEVSSSQDTASAEAEIMPIQESYDVTVTWKGMIFTYCEEHNGDWNPTKLDYNEGSVPAHWESSDESVQNKYGTITIQSNKSISYTISFSQSEELGNAIAAVRYLESAPQSDDWSTQKADWSQNNGRTDNVIYGTKYQYTNSLTPTDPLPNPSRSLYVLPGLAGTTDYSIINKLSDGVLGTISILIVPTDNPFSDPSASEGPGTSEELILE